jgi:uncharacterized membrane protein YagU involved in acid resistance
MGMIWHYNYFFSALAWTSSRYAQLLVFYATLEKCCLEPYCHFEILLFYVYMAVDMIWHETSASFGAMDGFWILVFVFLIVIPIWIMLFLNDHEPNQSFLSCSLFHPV